MKLTTYVLREIIRLRELTTYSDRQIAEILGIAANTVGNYRRKIDKQKLLYAQAVSMTDEELIAKLMIVKGRDLDKQIPDFKDMHQRLTKNKYLTLQVLWVEYKAIYKENAYCYSQFTHYYRKYLKKIDVVMRQRHYPGEVMYVDYAGTLIPWIDQKNGDVKREAQVFVAVLGHSNNTFVWASRSQKLGDWIEAHNLALYFFGGVPEAVVPDNLKSAVTKPGSNLVLNRTYEEMARYYDFVIIPARIMKARDKAKVEQGVLFSTRWIIARLLERTFYSIEEINQAIAELLPELNERPLRNYPGTRQSRFEEGDKQALAPLPEHPFEFAVWVPAQKVGKDYHIRVHGHWYSVPFNLVGEEVEVRVTHNMLEFIHQNKRVAIHQLHHEEGGFTTDRSHMPPSHQAYADQDLDGFVKWAKDYGPSTEAVVRAQFEKHHAHSIVARNACNNLCKLARLYEMDEFESACARAEEIASLTVKSVQSILRTGLYKLDNSELSTQQQLPLHDNVRGSSYYTQGGV